MKVEREKSSSRSAKKPKRLEAEVWRVHDTMGRGMKSLRNGATSLYSHRWT